MASFNVRKKKRSKPQDDLHAWARQLLDDGEDRRRPYEGQWWEQIATYMGDLWAEWDPYKGMLQATKPAEYRVRIPINLAQPVVRTEYAKLVKNKPILDVVSKSTDKKDLNAADAGDNIMQYGERSLALPRVRRRAVWWALVCGQGGIFVDYDPKAVGEVPVPLGPDGEPIFDERAIDAAKKAWRDKKKAQKTMTVPIGDQVVKAVSPFNYVFDLSQIYIEDAMYCIISEAWDVDAVYQRWGVEVEEESDVQPGIIERRLIAKSDRASKLTWDGNTLATRLCKLSRLFVRPGHRYFPNGAEIIFTEEGLVDVNEDYPFTHAELPLSVMGHIPFGVSQYQLSVLGQIKGPVLEASRTVSQLVENRNLMANPPWIVYRQQRMKDDIENRPGLRIEIDYVPGIPAPSPVQMPEMPMYVQQLIETFKSNVLEISGQGETSQGKVPAGARSGVAIAYLQEEDDTKLGPTVQEFEEMIERSHGQILSNYGQFYSIPRTVQIYRPHSEPEVIDFQSSMLDGVAGIVCQAGSALPRSKAAKQQYILDLFDRGIETDPVRVKQMLELSQGEPDEIEIDKTQAERENRELQKGKTQDVLEWYNHQMHHMVHRRFMKSPDFHALDAEVQKLFLDHDEEHSAWERKQAQAQMVAGQMGGGPGAQGGPPGGAAPNVANGMPNQPAPGGFTQDLGGGAAMEAPPQ